MRHAFRHLSAFRHSRTRKPLVSSPKEREVRLAEIDDCLGAFSPNAVSGQLRCRQCPQDNIRRPRLACDHSCPTKSRPSTVSTRQAGELRLNLASLDVFLRNIACRKVMIVEHQAHVLDKSERLQQGIRYLPR